MGLAKIGRMGILVRTAVLAWLVALVTLVVFIVVVVPSQKAAFLSNLESKARGVSASLQDVAAGAAVSEDYSAVVDHCNRILTEDPSIDYLVLTRRDGFSIVHERGSWRIESLPAEWHPEVRISRGALENSPLVGNKVFSYRSPFDYSGIAWGWIHVGLSLQSYEENVRSLYRQTILALLLGLGLGLVASIFYARQLTDPIVQLRRAVQLLANGDLSVRATVVSHDEVGDLATAFNQMTESLLQRDAILHSIRFAAQQFLSAESWQDVINEVLGRLGQAAGANRIYLFEIKRDAPEELVASRRFEWVSSGTPPHLHSPDLQNLDLHEGPLTRWAQLLGQGKPVVGSISSLPPEEQPLLAAQDIQSLVLVPVEVSGEWWGFIGLDDCEGPRAWSDAEVLSLRAAADTLGAAIERHRAAQSLVVAKEAAEAANVAKSQFLANMSHEIRTPISGVMGTLYLLKRANLDPKNDRYVSNALIAAETLLTVLGDVLDFSKIEAGRLELDEARIDLSDLIDGAMRIFTERAAQKRVELVYRVGPSVPESAIGDGNRLRQVLVNLINNALKFTDEGRIFVDCTQESDDEDHIGLRYEVSDTGCGISEGQLDSVFEAFSQADNSTTRTHGGTGLGLAICRQLCELMGGAIGVESHPGQGSRFWFTVRIRRDGERPPAPLQNRSVFERLRALVVDDCSVSRDIVREYIESWGGQADEASDAALGLEELRRAARRGEPFSLAIVDWRMPGIDGLALARLIREDVLLADTRLILMSGFAMTDPDTEATTELFSASLPKPVRRSDLYHAIVDALNVEPDRSSPLRAVPTDPVDLESVRRLSGTVLLVEDNAINREVAGDIIGLIGYDCIFAENGREAVEVTKSRAADVVLMDCQMPLLDGYEATRIIREWEQAQTDGGLTPRTPIIALTAHAMKGDREVCLQAGMDDFLTKPLEPELLAATLEKWMPTRESTELPGDPQMRVGPVDSPPQAETCDLPPTLEPATSPLQGQPVTREPAEPDAPPAPLGREDTGSPDPIDREDLLRRFMGRESMADRLVAKFADLGSEYVASVVDAVTRQDAQALHEAAHRLKGASSSVSAEPIRRLAEELEAHAQADNMAPTADLAAELSMEMERLLRYEGRRGEAA